MVTWREGKGEGGREREKERGREREKERGREGEREREREREILPDSQHTAKQINSSTLCSLTTPHTHTHTLPTSA